MLGKSAISLHYTENTSFPALFFSAKFKTSSDTNGIRQNETFLSLTHKLQSQSECSAKSASIFIRFGSNAYHFSKFLLQIFTMILFKAAAYPNLRANGYNCFDTNYSLTYYANCA